MPGRGPSGYVGPGPEAKQSARREQEQKGESVEERFAQMKKDVQKLARKRVESNPRLSFEDLVQEGMAALWVAWLRYKDSTSCPKALQNLCFKAVINKMTDSHRLLQYQKRQDGITKSGYIKIEGVPERLLLENILDVRFRIRTVASELSEPGQKLFQELMNPSDEILSRISRKRGWQIETYAEGLGLDDKTVRKAFQEIKRGLESVGIISRYTRVEREIQTREKMEKEKDKSINPLDYGLSLPEPEEEVGWDPVLDDPNTREEVEAEERHEAEKEVGSVVDLDQPATLGDLGEMGAEIDREEAKSVSSKSEEKLDISVEQEERVPEAFGLTEEESFEDAHGTEQEQKPKRKTKKKREKNDYMKGFEAGSDSAKVWAHLEELLKLGAITRGDIREAYKTILGSDDEKAKKQARFLLFTLHKKKELIVRVERGLFKRATDDSQ